MILSDFTENDGDEQIRIIKEVGVLVGKREQLNYNISLYQIDNFYAEIFFRKKDDSIWKVGGFDHPILLKPYLDQIDITSIGL